MTNQKRLGPKNPSWNGCPRVMQCGRPWGSTSQGWGFTLGVFGPATRLVLLSLVLPCTQDSRFLTSSLCIC